MRTKHYSLLNLLFVCLAVFFWSCEGPEGPIGPQGATGTTGETGAAGADASLYCTTCHNNPKRQLTEIQLSQNLHTTGTAWAKYGNRADCGRCHAHEGFVETVATGWDAMAVATTTPHVLGCESCHTRHISMDPNDGTDYALRKTSPVSWMINAHATSQDFGKTGNTCVYCHQPRPRDGFPVVPNGVASYVITSSTWGPHHSSQGAVFAGKFGYEIAGTTAYSNSKHTNKDCAFCHMVKSPTNSAFGGHTFHVDEGTCNNCHNGAVNMETLASTFDTKLELLRSKLETKGLVSATGAVLPTHKSDGVTLVVGGLGRAWTNQEAGAVFNYLYSKEDASHGLHNPKYVMALLSNTIEMVDRW